MRIIGGEAGGRTIRAPKGGRTRPTTDRVRESLFSLLGDLDGTVICDGFAGSGALGLEALSRGARLAWFFDRDRAAIRAVQGNVAELGWEDRARVHAVPFAVGIAMIPEPLDLIFLDPPYETGSDLAALDDLSTQSCCVEDTLVVVERSARDGSLEHWAFDHDEDREFGDTILSFFYRNAHSGPPTGG